MRETLPCLPSHRQSRAWQPRNKWSILVARGDMKRIGLSSLLAVALICTSGWAQRGAMHSGGARSAGQGPGWSHPSHNGSLFGGKGSIGLVGPSGCRRGNCFDCGGWYSPSYWPGYYWGYSPYDVGGLDPYWELGEPEEAQPPSSQQPTVIVMREPEQRTPSAPAASPKVIEVPPARTADSKQIVPPKATPPAVFILTNGQRLEAKRYLLTQDTLQIQHGRDQQTISLDEVNLQATIAANRERGLDLQIPENKNQLMLGF